MIRKPALYRRTGHWLMDRLAARLLSTPVISGLRNRVHIGRGVSLQNVVLSTRSGDIWIGDGTFMGHGVMILAATHDVSVPASARSSAVPKSGHDVYIGSNVWIGSGAIVLGPSTIGDGAVVGAGAVVKGNVLPDLIVAGVPAHPCGQP